MALRKTSFDFHSKESSLICIGQKGETYGTFITFGQRERVIIGDCWKSIDM